MKQRQDPFQDKSQEGRPGFGALILRLGLLLLVLTACLTAVLILYFQWTSQNSDDLSAGNPDLSLPEQLFLLTRLNQQADQLALPAGSGAQPQPFTINPGESADQIAANLHDAGLVENPDLFQAYIRFYGIDTQLEAGEFVLNPMMTIPEIAQQLTQAVAQEVTLRFLEGWRLEEMIAHVQAVRPAQIDPVEFGRVVKREAAFDLSGYDFLVSLPADATLEGFLFPDTYRVPLDADAAYLVTAMLDNFGRRVTPAMRQGFGVQGLSLREAVTLASIVEREAVLAAERPVIAGVFYNRLALEMKLETDPTVQYALGYQAVGDTWWKSPLLFVDLEVDSPYNTYRYPGLPPGPIANPGLSSLEAVAAPQASEFIFFFADCNAQVPGTHLFSVTYEEHLANVQSCR